MAAALRAFFTPPAGGPFSNRKLLQIFLPVLAEQFIANILGLVDTLLASSFNDAATAGVSHAFIITNVASAVITGLAVGGSVVTVQFFGSKDNRRASDSARCCLVFTLLISLLCCSMLLAYPAKVITLLVGNVDRDVLDYGVTYLIVSSLVLPFTGLFSACTATFRAQGNTRIPMLASTAMLLLSIVCKFIFSLVIPLGVLGAGLANLIGSAVTSVVLFAFMHFGRLAVSFRRGSSPFLEREMFLQILRYSIPTAIENASVQIGLLLVQRIIAGYGVVHSAAHGIASRLQPLSYLPSSCWGIVAMIAAGQCCGAGSRELAEKCVRHIMRLSYAWMLILNMLWFIFADPLLHLFGGSPETLRLAKQLFLFYCFCAIFMYSTAYGLPQALRGAGDVRYTMLVSLGTMFLIRLGAAYLLGTRLGLGTFGVWIAMAIDWAVRSLFYLLRFRSGRWLAHCIVHS